MPNSTLSFASSSSFRDVLMAKNLASYSVTGVYTPPSGPLNYEVSLSQSPVVDSPNDLIANDPYAKQLYPLNQFGPDGGYNIDITFNGPPLPVNSNQGPYYVVDSKVLASGDLYLNVLPTSPAIKNIFLPPDAKYVNVFSVVDTQNNNQLFLPYPTTFVPSFYSPYEILISDNPTGDSGPLSNDSFLARLGSKQLRALFKERIDTEIYQSTIGLVNLESLQDPFEASMIASGKEPLIYRNWRITIPEQPVTRAVDFATRLSGAYWPVSFIPGDYFNENTVGGLQSRQTSVALNIGNQLTGGLLAPILNLSRNPSQLFLANTGNGQRSVLFKNLEYNRYQPGYKKEFGGILGIVGTIVDLAASIINPNGTISGGYYVGSTNSEPSLITSPSNAIPKNAYGEQVQTPVYGPSEMGILYEGNISKLNFGLAGLSYTNSGAIDGGFLWTSKKYKSNAGYSATPGGGNGSKDEGFSQISSYIQKDESTNVDFKENSILDNTQRLIDASDAVSGGNRLKHVGNAINQVSKVFNDGYKEMTKGSMVVSYKDNTSGDDKGMEYCRVFTKDTPYLTYGDLQKTDGITTSGRRFTYSVLDNTYNLNIAPLKGVDSTNIIQGGSDWNSSKGKVKKYMFSIENLAWRTSSKPGFTYEDLPVCERGPNGGRVMWFPPYNLQFNDSSQADWNATTFLGRPEPIYTYKSTSRTGSLSWKMIVDHPSVMNTIVEKQLKNASKQRVDSIIDSFFAGCVKYDIYELAIKFNTLPVSELYTIQTILNDPRKTNLETIGKVVREIPKDNSGNGGTSTASVETDNTSKKDQPEDNSVKEFQDKYVDFAFYFENDIPGKNPQTTTSIDYEDIYKSYTSDDNISLYQKNADSVFKSGNTDRNTTSFFNTIIKPNFDEIAGGDKNFIVDAYNILSKGLGTITIEMEGSASAIAEVEYNRLLSERRISTIKNFFKNKPIGEANLGKFMEGPDATFKVVAKKGTGEQTVIPKTSINAGSGSGTTDNSGTGTDVNCTVDQKPDIVFKGSKTIALINATSAMACRRVRISNIKVDPKPKQKEDPEPQKEVVNPPIATTGVTSSAPVKKPESTLTISQEVKAGISKKILRYILSECDYFQVIKENDPILYDSFREKIKYFNPTFHSMTPEGLNARLTFLNQCVRPGETIPVISDNQIKSPDAVNTSFGAPPVLILRIGDFYNTKIIPDSVAFTYEPLSLDMNPEGIGVQPMLANVTLSFKMIGGMGLKEPVDQLQNALSFNYYANTEIYDERATATEDTSALDKYVVDQIVAKLPPVTVKNAAVQPSNEGASTIGVIKTTTPTTGGETGEMSYMVIMDKMFDNAKTYFENSVNSLSELMLKTNYAMLQLICGKRNFKKGTVFTKMNYSVSILGKPSFQENVEKLFTKVNDDVRDEKNPIIKDLKGEGFTDPVILNILKTNLNKYINGLKSTLSTDIATVVNNKMTNQQVEMVQTIRKINYVNSGYDGKILENGSVKIYRLTSNLNNVETDYFKVVTSLNNFNELITKEKILPPDYKDDGSFTSQTDLGSLESKRFFTIVGRIFSDKNKLQDFKKKIMTPNLLSVKKPKNLNRVFGNIVDDLADKYKDEIKEEDKFFEKFKKSPEYKKYTTGVNDVLFKKSLPRIVNFTTVPDPATKVLSETGLKNLYVGDSSKINDFGTFDGKIKFN